MSQDRCLLIHPPFADPTQPYLSLPTLKGHLRAAGLDARVIDLNVESTYYLCETSTLRHLAERIGERFHRLNHTTELSFEEQREFRRLATARPAIEDLLAASPGPVEVLQDPNAFFDANEYGKARERLESLFDAVSAAYWPYRFGFNRCDREVVPWGFDLLDSYRVEGGSPLAAFYARIFDPPEDWNELADGRLWIDVSGLHLIGISIVFPSQIPEAFHLARFLKERNPRALVVLGGPAIHQSVVHMSETLRRRLFEFVDAVGLYEGEATVAELVRRSGEIHAASGPERRTILAAIPNLLTFDPLEGVSVLGPRDAVDLRDAAAPDYSDLDLDRYLAPSRTLLYAPTRGCYWGKCSFCYYGLAETATAAYREVPPDRVASDLVKLSKRYGVKNFYLSCDVLSPRYAVALAEALVERDAGIRWHCDLKVERYFTPERVQLLYRSGMRAVAFGIESGSDRILTLMRKGCDRATMTEINRLFATAGIATQWMTFTDHPDESVTEALDTVEWINAEKDSIALFLVGEFGLEQGSHIAREPERYGVTAVYFAEGDEFRLYALFRQRGGQRDPAEREAIDRAIEAVAKSFASRPYPWAGAISTHHTFLHFVRFGATAFKTHFEGGTPRSERVMRSIDQVVSHIAGLRRKPRYSIAAIERAEEAFFGRYLPRALYSTLPARRGFGQGAVAPLSLTHYLAAAAEVPPLRPFDQGD